jgi:hypothetical protein
VIDPATAHRLTERSGLRLAGFEPLAGGENSAAYDSAPSSATTNGSTTACTTSRGTSIG